MLQNIHDRSKGWLTWLIVIVISVTFALWGIHNYFGTAAQNAVVAKVNGQVINQVQFNRAFRRLVDQQQAQMGNQFPQSPGYLNYLRETLLKQMISTQALGDAARKQGYRVGQTQINYVIETVPAFQEHGQFSKERFDQALNAQQMTTTQLIHDIQNIMLISQVQSAYTNTTFVLPNELSSTSTLMHQKRDFSYIIVPASRFVKSVSIPDDVVKTYYQNHMDAFKSKEQVSIDYVELSLTQLTQNIHPSDEQIKQFYQDNLSMFTLPEQKDIAHILVQLPKDATAAQIAAAQTKVNTIAAQLKQGADFSKLALKDSDDTLSNKKGGSIGWISAGQLKGTFGETVQSLSMTTPISAPIRTQYGFDIIKLLAVKPSQIIPLNQATPKITTLLARQKAESLFADQSDQLANLAYENPTDLSIAAKTLGLQIQSTPLFSRSGAKDGIAANPKIYSAAFNNSVLAQGNNSDSIQLDPETVVILRVKQHQPSAVLPFTEVAPQIRSNLTQEAASGKAQVLAKQLLTQLQKGQPLAQLAKQNGLSAYNVVDASRNKAGVNTVIVNEGFTLPPPSTKIPVSAAAFALPDGDNVLLQLIRLVPADPKDVPTPALQAQLEKAMGSLDYDIYSLDTVSHAKIKITRK